MTPAAAIFVCLINVMNVHQPVTMPILQGGGIIRDSRALTMRGHLADTNAVTRVITVNDTWEGESPDASDHDRKITAHEFARYIALVAMPHYRQNPASDNYSPTGEAQHDEFILSVERKCYDAGE